MPATTEPSVTEPAAPVEPTTTEAPTEAPTEESSEPEQPEETEPITTAGPSYGEDGYNNQIVRP